MHSSKSRIINHLTLKYCTGRYQDNQKVLLKKRQPQSNSTVDLMIQQQLLD